MISLPDSWECATVGEIATVQLGRQRSPKNHSGPHMRPYLRSANVTWHGIDIADVNEMNFAPDEAATFELRDGDILLNEASGSPGEVGKPAIWCNEIAGACFQNTLLRVRSSEMDEGFLYWYFYNAAFTGRFGEAGRGVNIRHLGKQGLANFPIPVPPLPEQRRIVAAIDEHFSRLDAAVATIASVAARCQALLTSVYEEAFAIDRRQGDGSEGAVRTLELSECLDQLVDHRGQTPGKLGGEFEASGVRVVSAIHVKSGSVRFSERERFVSHEMFERWMPVRMRRGDILMTSEAPLGSLARVPDDEPLVLSQRLFGLRANPGLLTNDYLFHFLLSPTAQAQLRQRSSGTTVTGIRQAELRQVSVPVVPMQTQRRVVERLDEARSLVDHLVETARRAVSKGSGLRSSILAAGFSGRLVPQDPSDEPASALLERIAAERAATQSSRRKKAAS